MKADGPLAVVIHIKAGNTFYGASAFDYLVGETIKTICGGAFITIPFDLLLRESALSKSCLCLGDKLSREKRNVKVL